MKTKTERKIAALPKELHVYVTQEDIDCGVQGKWQQCPIARAVRRITGVRSIQVSSREVCVSSLNYDRRFYGNAQMEKFVGSFDLGGRRAVSPKRFMLRSP